MCGRGEPIDRGVRPPQRWRRGIHPPGRMQVGGHRNWVAKIGGQVVHEQARSLTVDRRHLSQHIPVIDLRAHLHVPDTLSMLHVKAVLCNMKAVTCAYYNMLPKRPDASTDKLQTNRAAAIVLIVMASVHRW